MFGKGKKLSGGTLDSAVVQHLKNKYNDEFVIHSRDYAGGFYGSIDHFTLRCQTFPNRVIKADHFQDGTIEDNYLSYYYQDKHRMIMQQFMEELVGECVVVSRITFGMSSMGLEGGFEGYLRNYPDLEILVILREDPSLDVETA